MSEETTREEPITNRDVPEGEAYSPKLLPETDERCSVQGRTPSARSNEDIYGKKINIGMAVPIAALEDMMAYHGMDVVEEFVRNATSDFRKRLMAAIAESASGELKVRVENLMRNDGSFDVMKRVYGKTTSDESKEGIATVPGYHWSMTTGGLCDELIRAEAEGGLKGMMGRINEIIGDES